MQFIELTNFCINTDFSCSVESICSNKSSVNLLMFFPAIKQNVIESSFLIDANLLIKLSKSSSVSIDEDQNFENKSRIKGRTEIT